MGRTQAVTRRAAITRQAAGRLFFSLGLFVVLVGLSTSFVYQTAINKAAHERAEDLAEFYRTRLTQLERDWELQSRDFRVRIEYTRLLEHPETATINLQAFITIQGGDRRFQYLHVEDRQGNRLFTFGKDLELDSIPLPEGSNTGYYLDTQKNNVYRVFIDQIWLGDRGMGRIALFFRIDNALLEQLATPGVNLTALYGKMPTASSLGERGIQEQLRSMEEESMVERKIVAWTLDPDTPLSIEIAAPVKVLFSTTELALAVSVIPIIDALILWFVLGTWLMRQARRINELGGAVQVFSEQQSLTNQLKHRILLAKDSINDEIHDVAGAIEQMATISESRKLERQQEEAQRRLWGMVFANTNEAILISDSNNRIITVNRTFTQLTGYTQEEIIGKNPSILSSGLESKRLYEEMWQQIDAVGHWEGEIQDRRKDGSIYPKWLSIVAVKDEEGSICNYVGTFIDITERKKVEERMIHLATHDSLTGLPNRTLLLEYINKGLAYAHRSNAKMALLFLDLDRFKWINDSLGHDQGDRLLKGVTKRLLEAIRNSDTVSRLGGDEFVVLLHDIHDLNDVSVAASKIIEHVARPFTLKNRELQITTSIGISLYPNDGHTAEQLLKHADAAMYSAKAAGKNQARFFDILMNQRAMERFEMENGLREALTSNQFWLLYQPKQCLQQGSVCGGAEALLRWKHPTLGLVPPDRFIPIAEETGLIIAIGEWVIQHACQQIRHWLNAGIAPGVIAVNVSAQQLESSNFADMVLRILREFELDPSALEFELTESAILQNPQQSIATLEKLRHLGFKLSLDDFGTGYSSLSYLKRLPVDSIKIDRSFIDGLPYDEDDAQIVRMTTAMAKSIGLAVVAEGVENPYQLGYLNEIGCDLVQGYYISKPIPPEDYENWLRARGFAHCDENGQCDQDKLQPSQA